MLLKDSEYIDDKTLPEEIVEGIRAVASGKRFLCEEVDILLKKEKSNNIVLTRREHELLKLITQGLTSTEIAGKVCLGYETVRSYRKNLHIKLGAHNIVELTRIALDRKLV
ncbi:hypothetical protein FACS189413_15260 [Bacteroidia bacterium]|nr:hypothetical protein FACS189413_15260 [Bacteroidia bacterium]